MERYMETSGTQETYNSFLIFLKVKKIDPHPHEKQKPEACFIYCTAEK